MKFLIIISLFLCIIKINTIDDECSRYKQVKDIKECIDKKTGMAHYGCCGYSMIISTQLTTSCLTVPNTKASKETYNKISEIVKDKAKLILDIDCSDKNDEIKGTCAEFYGISVSSPNSCLKLTTPKSDGTTCCGVRGKTVYNEYGVNFELPSVGCFALPNDEKQREKYIQQLIDQSQGRMKFEGYNCVYDDNYPEDDGSENHFKKLFLNIFIYSMLLLF